jgi:hypothetical protein
MPKGFPQDKACIYGEKIYGDKTFPPSEVSTHPFRDFAHEIKEQQSEILR